jgi:Immunoglobulin V-set domain
MSDDTGGITACSCAVSTSSDANVLSALDSRIVDVGSDVSIPCSVTGSGTVSWLFIMFSSARQFVIYRNDHVVDEFKDKFKAVTGRPSGNHSLTLVNAQSTDSGWYVCVVENGSNISRNIVITLNVTG